MRLFQVGLLLLGLLATTISARADLSELLQWQLRGDSGAYVSSGFHDWRSVSKYRSRPGLHAGYDIAMLAGSAVRTPWAGRVVAITPWYGSELGVTVRLENGWEATFGHITSSVSVGQQVTRGDLIGRVVVDHLDVKVRDSSGSYVDFALRKIASFGMAQLSPRPAALTHSEQEKKAAAQAFGEYRLLVETLAVEEVQVRSGLLARNALSQRHKRLNALRPLAAVHAELMNLQLPTKTEAPTLDTDPGRPVTDALLGEARGSLLVR